MVKLMPTLKIFYAIELNVFREVNCSYKALYLGANKHELFNVQLYKICDYENLHKKYAVEGCIIQRPKLVSPIMMIGET